jgi:hypothetical protein
LAVFEGGERAAYSMTKSGLMQDFALPRPVAVPQACAFCDEIPEDKKMCRNIKTLFNFEPPATEQEIRASALQFVRKLSGFNKPSHGNAQAFDRAVEEVSAAARRLLTSLHTHAPTRDREVEAEKARERSKLRFG